MNNKKPQQKLSVRKARIFAVLSLITIFLPPLGLILFGLWIYYYYYIESYFKGKMFRLIKEKIQAYIKNSNELNHHIEELKQSYVGIETVDYGTSSMVNTSKHNYKKAGWEDEEKNRHVHNCSAQVCKNASAQPFKYLVKYFNIEPTEKTLSMFESVLNDFAAAEQGKQLLVKEKEEILSSLQNDIPILIYRYNRERLERELGFEEVDLSTLYFPVYSFQYVSANGYSSSRCDIEFNIENLEKFVAYIDGLIQFKNSVRGQRALMTAKLREQIKIRDNYTCKKCSLSTQQERNLLLEIDHIMPLSKGGVTVEENLQTLCWRCNRTKGSKIEAA